MNDFIDNIAWAHAQDRRDPLAGYRGRFHIPVTDDGSPTLYLAGNSLGLPPRAARDFVTGELDDWARFGVEGHFHGRRPWMPYHEQFAAPAARLVGAREHEIVYMNTLTVNLHLMMVSFYRPAGDRTKILIEQPAFPSDRYAVVSQLKFHGLDPDEHLLEIAPRAGEHAIRENDILELIAREGKHIALVMLPGVQYYSGQVLDMPAITRVGHEQGAIVGFDLAHAAGNVPLALHDWEVDFAAWCSYKYLNAGPGAIAGCYVHERFANDDTLPRFAGWWGHDKDSRFRMGPDFRPIPGAEGWQLSNPPIFSLAPVLASLEIFSEAGMPALCEKSERLTSFLAWLIEQRLDEHIYSITPAQARGCQLSLRLRRAERGKTVQRQLIERGVLCDWREPDVIRVAPVPLYNRFADVYRFVDHLEELLEQ